MLLTLPFFLFLDIFYSFLLQKDVLKNRPTFFKILWEEYMKLKKQFKIFIFIFIILVIIFAIKDTSELLAKLELNTIAFCDAQDFVDE